MRNLAWGYQPVNVTMSSRKWLAHLNILQCQILRGTAAMRPELWRAPGDEREQIPDGGHDGVHVEISVITSKGIS